MDIKIKSFWIWRFALGQSITIKINPKRFFFLLSALVYATCTRPLVPLWHFHTYMYYTLTKYFLILWRCLRGSISCCTKGRIIICILSTHMNARKTGQFTGDRDRILTACWLTGLPKSMSSGFKWEILPQYMRWRATQKDTCYQSPPHTCIYTSIQTCEHAYTHAQDVKKLKIEEHLITFPLSGIFFCSF